MTTDQLMGALCDISEPAGRIMDGAQELAERIAGLLKGWAAGDAATVRAVLEIVPYLLKKHRADTLTIVSALTGKTAEEIMAANGLEIIREVRDSVDQELIRLFFSPGGTSPTK